MRREKRKGFERRWAMADIGNEWVVKRKGKAYVEIK